MRRVVVPLDGTERAEKILPDARRVAGPDGELILVHNVGIVLYYGANYLADQRRAVAASRGYLNHVAERLREQGARVETETLIMDNASVAVDEEAAMADADMIAMATHAREGLDRLVRGSVAWQALVHSPVPVLLRHFAHGQATPSAPARRRILVPLDGSELAEKALPLADSLAQEWQAEIYLTQVVFTLARAPRGKELETDWLDSDDIEPAKREAAAYLREIATGLNAQVQTRVLLGQPADVLIAAARAWNITDIVMASHGRTGRARVVLGSVADSLIHHLDLPIIVVPALASAHAAAAAE